jgi:hypothetical protein
VPSSNTCSAYEPSLEPDTPPPTLLQPAPFQRAMPSWFPPPRSKYPAAYKAGPEPSSYTSKAYTDE